MIAAGPVVDRSRTFVDILMNTVQELTQHVEQNQALARIQQENGKRMSLNRDMVCGESAEQ